MNHLKLAHLAWKEHLSAGDHVIDATLGNGHDALFLANLVLTPTSGSLTGFDIQEKAIQATEKRLEAHLSSAHLSRVELRLASHSPLPSDLEPPQLIVYNLGYLPGGDKSKTTLAEETLESIDSAAKLLSKNGLISITCYPGHSEGEKETNFIESHLKSDSFKAFRVNLFHCISKPKSPRLILLYNY